MTSRMKSTSLPPSPSDSLNSVSQASVAAARREWPMAGTELPLPLSLLLSYVPSLESDEWLLDPVFDSLPLSDALPLPLCCDSLLPTGEKKSGATPRTLHASAAPAALVAAVGVPSSAAAAGCLSLNQFKGFRFSRTPSEATDRNHVVGSSIPDKTDSAVVLPSPSAADWFARSEAAPACASALWLSGRELDAGLPRPPLPASKGEKDYTVVTIERDLS